MYDYVANPFYNSNSITSLTINEDILKKYHLKQLKPSLEQSKSLDFKGWKIIRDIPINIKEWIDIDETSLLGLYYSSVISFPTVLLDASSNSWITDFKILITKQSIEYKDSILVLVSKECPDFLFADDYVEELDEIVKYIINEAKKFSNERINSYNKLFSDQYYGNVDSQLVSFDKNDGIVISSQLQSSVDSNLFICDDSSRSINDLKGINTSIYNKPRQI